MCELYLKINQNSSRTMWHMSTSSAVGTEIAAKQQSAPSRRLQFMFVSKTPMLSSGSGWPRVAIRRRRAARVKFKFVSRIYGKEKQAKTHKQICNM